MTWAVLIRSADESTKTRDLSMSDLFFNKIAAAGLAAALGFIGINKLAGMAVHAEIPSTPAYSKYVAGESTVVEDIPAPFPQAEWIAGIDPVKGAKVFKKCTSCHNADEGGKNSTGPALWNVVGRAAGTGADFSYSSAMASSGIVWNYEELDGYLENPKTYLPKNKMAFIGVKKPADRAAVIEYLRLASNDPIAPLTEPAVIESIEDAIETVVEDLGTESAIDVVDDITEDAVEEAAVDTPDQEPVPELDEETTETVDAIEDAVEDVAEDTKDALETAEEKVDDVVEEIKEAVPTPDE